MVLGSGKIGSVMAKEFSKIIPNSDITFGDISYERSQAAAKTIAGADWAVFNTADYSALLDNIKDYDLVLGALPGEYGFKAIKAVIETGVNMVDVSFTPEDPLKLDAAAKQAEVTVIPDCGVAPGLSNILVGYSASRLEKVREAHIMVGGIPDVQIPPLGYTITWSAEGLIDEYVRDVNIIEEGKSVIVPALSGLELIDFPGVGKLEAFYTDGLRSLTQTLPNVENMWEKTLRYPGHVEKIKLLRDLGFFDDEVLKVQATEIPPRIVTARLLEKSLWKPDVSDLLAMNIEVTGISRGDEKRYKYQILDHYDQSERVTAMARTTAYTAAIVASMLVKGKISKKGVIPPERLGMDQDFTKLLLEELKKRNIIIKEIQQ
jgi:saccharopine dehydrogenase-like NADP-dependent oxidoreductase